MERENTLAQDPWNIRLAYEPRWFGLWNEMTTMLSLMDFRSDRGCIPCSLIFSCQWTTVLVISLDRLRRHQTNSHSRNARYATKSPHLDSLAYFVIFNKKPCTPPHECLTPPMTAPLTWSQSILSSNSSSTNPTTATLSPRIK